MQLVLQHCGKTSWNAKLRVFPPTFKLVLQQIRLAQVVPSCVNTDFWLDKITRESHTTRELRHWLQKQVCLGPVKRATRTDFVARSTTTKFRFDSGVVKRAPTSLFTSLCSNVANQVARFCYPFYRPFTHKNTEKWNIITDKLLPLSLLIQESALIPLKKKT